MFSPFYPIFGLLIPISLMAPLASMLSQSILRSRNRIHFAYATLWLPGAHLSLAIYIIRVPLVLTLLPCRHSSPISLPHTNRPLLRPMSPILFECTSFRLEKRNTPTPLAD